MIRKNWRNMDLRNRENEYRNSFRRRLEKNILPDYVIEAESQKEFDILAKTMGATDKDLEKEAVNSSTTIIGRAKSDPEMRGQKVVLTLVYSSGVGYQTLEQVCSTGGKSKEIILKHVRKGDLVCIEGRLLKGSDNEVSIHRITFLKSNKTKTKKNQKHATTSKASANEGEGCVYKVSCVTREYAATRKKYSGEFESLQDAMKVCAQAYNAGVDVFVECGDQPFAKIYTKTKEFEDFTDDNSASKAFREAMLWAKSPERKKTNEDDIPAPETVTPQDLDLRPDASADQAIQAANSATFPDISATVSESSEVEDPSDIRVYAKNHKVIIATESRINGFRIHRLAPGNPKPTK